jgi:hypothetical protein
MLLSKETFVLQRNLGRYCRTGKNAPETSIPEHTKEYRRLVFGVMKDTLKTAFPITRKLVGKKRWKKMAKNFVSEHDCQNPQVWKLPYEMYEFYVENKFPFRKTYEFINELMLFEWMDIEVFMMEDISSEVLKKEGNLHKDYLIANPEIKILPLKYPLHSKNIKKVSDKDAADYFALFVRNFESKKVKILDISYHFAEFLLLLNEQPQTFSDLKKHFIKYEKQENTLNEIIEDYIQFSLENNLILGFKNL